MLDCESLNPEWPAKFVMPKFEYEIKISKRARWMRLAVHTDGRVVVTKPAYMPDFLVARFLKKHTDWIEQKLEHFQKHPARILGKRSVKEYKAYKEAARALVHVRLAHFLELYNFKAGGVRIGNQSSRWGSCSARGNLNFNYKIIFLPKELQDYIIVHEICHLKEHNHSSRFWKLVAEQIPDWKKLRKELKKY